MSHLSACVDALNRCQQKDLENLRGEINWLSLMELAFSSLVPFGPHYSPLSFFVTLPSLPLSLSAFCCAVGALPPPAACSCKRLSNSQAAEDGEGGATSAHRQGE